MQTKILIGILIVVILALGGTAVWLAVLDDRTPVENEPQFRDPFPASDPAADRLNEPTSEGHPATGSEPSPVTEEHPADERETTPPPITPPTNPNPPPVNSGGSEVWFGPNGGSVDIVKLFTNPELWPSARAEMDVFQIYSVDKKLVDAQAFSKLRKWGKKIAIEATVPFQDQAEEKLVNGKIIWGKCKSIESQLSFAVEMTTIQIEEIQANGGKVNYITMDSPFFYGVKNLLPENPCPSPRPTKEIAQTLASYIRQVQAVYPDVLIGDLEPYPALEINQIKKWVIAMEDEGTPLAFFRLDMQQWMIMEIDNPWTAQEKIGDSIKKDAAADIRDLKSFLENRGVPFGIVLTDSFLENLADTSGVVNTYNPNYSDKDYYENTMQWIGAVKEASAVPNQLVFQSWIETYAPGKIYAREKPNNLPETAPYSHTRLVIDGLNILRD